MIRDFNDYQAAAKGTAAYPDGAKIYYPALGLASEAGEVAGKVKKALRDDAGSFTEERKEAIRAEIGDVLWYCAALASDLGFNLGDIADENIAKLLSRKERGTIQGDGDNR
jgi:NTP pyrophosphatase (non-canonical NTP hydrolase)